MRNKDDITMCLFGATTTFIRYRVWAPTRRVRRDSYSYHQRDARCKPLHRDTAHPGLCPLKVNALETAYMYRSSPIVGPLFIGSRTEVNSLLFSGPENGVIEVNNLLSEFLYPVHTHIIHLELLSLLTATATSTLFSVSVFSL